MGVDLESLRGRGSFGEKKKKIREEKKKEERRRGKENGKMRNILSQHWIFFFK